MKATRFWNRVIKKDGCWLWVGTKNNKGYGVFGWKGKTVLAHRVSWEIHFGKIPKGMLVCHKCDNPECTNPFHLFVGTFSDNTRDSYRKGRMKSGFIGNKGNRGEGYALHKLKKNDVLTIRKLLKNGYGQKEIAEIFNVSPACICNINTGRTWWHLK